MLVMHDRCDSTADENEADVLKLQHSSCVTLSHRKMIKGRRAGGFIAKKNCFG